MKKSITLFSVAIFLSMAAISFSSCDKLKEKLFKAFSTGGGNVNFTIPIVTSTTAEGKYATEKVYINVDSIIKAETGGVFSLNDVKIISMESAEIFVNNADQDNNLGNFEVGAVIFNTFNTSKNDWNEPMLLATNDLDDEYADYHKMIITEKVNMKEHLRSNEIAYWYGAKARRVTTKPLECTLKVKLHIE
ncbi:MAG: hypothetical protein ACO3BD_05475 [Chitinophagaceae bacterium]